MLLSSGSRLGNYAILEALGVGGMGEAYRARDNNLDRDVALKALPDPKDADTHIGWVRASSGDAKYARRVALKTVTNSGNLFRRNQNIQPTGNR